MTFSLTNDPRVRARAIAEIRASLREPDQVAYLERRSEELAHVAYGECGPHFARTTGRLIEGRAPAMAARNLAAVLHEFAQAIKPETRPFLRAFERPPAPPVPERRPRRYRSRGH